MEENPLQLKKNKIDALRKEAGENIGLLFDNKEELTKKIDELILRLDAFQRGGLEFNKEEIATGLKSIVGIKDKSSFISNFLRVIEPLIVLKATKAELFEGIHRENELSRDGNLKLSEVLYTGLSKEGRKNIEVHLAPATEFIKKRGIGNFKKEIEKGFAKLAGIVKSDPSIERINAVSWIVAKNPLLLKKLGFIIEGEISVKEREEDYLGDKRPIAKAFMKREDFLVRYDTSS